MPAMVENIPILDGQILWVELRSPTKGIPLTHFKISELHIRWTEVLKWVLRKQNKSKRS